MAVWAYLAIAWLGGVALALWWHRAELLASWREPVLRHPVLIVESDDWGAGPVGQATALERLAELLEGQRDASGRRPVMTLAVVLAVPDGDAVRRSGQYRRRSLADALFSDVREALSGGAARGVFALQLHGLEHYWPAALMGSGDEAVANWREQTQPGATERLPAFLQSRWIDATTLPSRELAHDEIEAAVADETALFAAIFGRPAAVAVPPTFVWNDVVERAWARHGIRFVVTPGRRSNGRDADGALIHDRHVLRNGEHGAGVHYVVRNDYFEPERGHTAADALAALRRKWDQGRPCLLETHRSNFLGASAERAFDELQSLLQAALRTFPELRFMSTEELAEAMCEPDHPMIEHRLSRRLAAWVNRLRKVPRLWRLAQFSGIALLAAVVGAAADGRHNGEAADAGLRRSH